jgi:hypothetical protein
MYKSGSILYTQSIMEYIGITCNICTMVSKVYGTIHHSTADLYYYDATNPTVGSDLEIVHVCGGHLTMNSM